MTVHIAHLEPLARCVFATPVRRRAIYLGDIRIDCRRFPVASGVMRTPPGGTLRTCRA